MFRVKDSEVDAGQALAETLVQIALLFALLINLGSAYLILIAYLRLGSFLDRGVAMSLEDVASQRREVAWQMASSLLLSILLAACGAAIWWFRRRYLASQKSLRQVKMLAHNILGSMDRGVITTNHQGVITSINSAGNRLLEVDFECVGRPLAAISPGELPLVEVYQQVIEQTTVRDRDFKLHRRGQALRLRVDGHPLTDTAGNSLGCVIHLRDVSERILLEERMRRMERFIGLASLASGLHHEIKNPLTALSIHIQLLEESLQESDQAASRGVEELHVLKTEVQRLNGVLDSFRSFANLEHLHIQDVDVVEVVDAVLRLIGPQAAKQRVEIAFRKPPGELPPLPLDVEKFEQALLNLVINALEAMPDGGQLIIALTLLERELQVSVTDNGPGIPEEIQPYLFQPYFSTKTGGSGMGLALGEKLISQHGGRIDYRTGPEGTTFDITIPLEPCGDTHA